MAKPNKNKRKVKVFAEASPMPESSGGLYYEYIGDYLKDLAKNINPQDSELPTEVDEYIKNNAQNLNFNDFTNNFNDKIDYSKIEQIEKNFRDINHRIKIFKEEGILEPAIARANVSPGDIDSTFIKEAENVKKYYSNDPNTEVDIIPLYGDKQKARQELKKMGPNDKMVLMGHSGSKLAGIQNEKWADYIKESDVGEGYIGSCSFQDYSEPFKNIKNKDIYIRPASTWLGFNPQADSFMEGMFGRQTNKEGRMILPVEEGKSYKKYEEGGSKMPKTNISPGSGMNMAGQFSGSILDEMARGYDEQSTTNMALDIGAGALKGAGSGAAIGSVVPGVGTAIGAGAGALVGGVGAAFGASSEKKAAEEMEEKKNKLENARRFNKELSGIKPVNYQPVFAEGGDKPEPMESLPMDKMPVDTEQESLDFYDLKRPAAPPGDNTRNLKQTEYYPGNWRKQTVSGLRGYLNKFHGLSLDEFDDRYTNATMAKKKKFLKRIESENPFKFKFSQSSLGEPTLEVNALNPDEKPLDLGLNLKEGGKKKYQKGGSMLERFEGPTHEQGGIDINVAEVEGGETEFDLADYIFSDDITVPGTKKTFAEQSKKIDKKYSEGNRFADNAKKRDLTDLMKEQEQVKGPDNKEQMQEGGFLSGDDTTSDLLSLAPIAATLGQTVGDIFSRPMEVDLPKLEGQAYDPQLISSQPYVKNVRDIFGEKERAIEAGARTPGQYLAGRIQSSTEETKAVGDIMSKIDRLNQRELSRAEQMKSQQRYKNLDQSTQEVMLNLKSQAAKRNAVRQDVSSLATQSGQLARDIRQTKAQKRYRDRMMDFYDELFGTGDTPSNESFGTRETPTSKAGASPEPFGPLDTIDEIPLLDESIEEPVRKNKNQSGFFDPRNLPYNEFNDYENIFFEPVS